MSERHRTSTQQMILLLADRAGPHIAATIDQLRATEHRVVRIDSEQRLWQDLSEYAVDLVIVDGDLPSLDIHAVCRRMRDDHSVSIILLSSHHTPEELVRGLEHGADDYLTRPFEPAELVARANALLRRRKIIAYARRAAGHLPDRSNAPNACPHLGLQEDANSVYAGPTNAHRCFVTGIGAHVELEHQTHFCLSADHPGCAQYTEPVIGHPHTTSSDDAPFVRRPVLWLSLAAAALLLFAFTAFTRGPLGAAFLTEPAPAEAAILMSPTWTATVTPAAELALAQEAATATATATPTSAVPTATSTAGALAPNERTVELFPVPNAVGWVSSSERLNHFGEENLHAGYFEDAVYYGALQFRLDTIPPGAAITDATLELVGLNAESLGSSGTWTLNVLGPDLDEDWTSVTYQQLAAARVLATIPPALNADDLGVRQSNTFTFEPSQLGQLERRLESGLISFRIDGPTQGENNLFTWNTGVSSLDRPTLRIAYTLPSTPTPAVVVNTPTPENIVTAAAVAATATYQATAVGTATPLPLNYVTATPPVVIVNTATPETAATAQMMAAEATARAYLYGTPTPFPAGAWTATPIPPTATPTGTPTSTPVPLLIPLAQIPTPTGVVATATPTPSAIPAVLRGKIVFRSDRMGTPQTFVMDPDGSNIAWLTDEWAYSRALDGESFSPDRSQRVFVRSRPEPGLGTFYEIWVQNTADNFTFYLTGGSRITYSPVWSPTSNTIAFVGQDAGNDEIYLIDLESKHETRLTDNEWQWDKHPSWSPDGSQIVFWSNRGDAGQQGIWVMNADGSNERPLLQDRWNNWDPVWIK